MLPLHSRRSRLLALPLAAAFASTLGPATGALGRADLPASAASTIALRESGRLHLLSKHGFTLYEQGPAAGTVSGTIYVRLQIVSTSHVTAEVSISPRGGTISGTASASYHRGHSSASFAGFLSITRGTGNYSHAHGSHLSFTGTIQRSNDAIDTSVVGTVSE